MPTCIIYVILIEIVIILYFMFRCFRRTVNKLYPSLTCPKRLLGIYTVFKLCSAKYMFSYVRIDLSSYVKSTKEHIRINLLNLKNVFV